MVKMLNQTHINMLINNIVDEDCYLWWCTDKKGSMYLISTRILIAMRPNNEYVYGNDRIVVNQIKGDQNISNKFY